MLYSLSEQISKILEDMLVTETMVNILYVKILNYDEDELKKLENNIRIEVRKQMREKMGEKD